MKPRLRPLVLDKIRDEQELPSDEALARYLGLALRTIKGLRAGRPPSVPTLVRIMDAAHIKSIHAALEQPEEPQAA